MAAVLEVKIGGLPFIRIGNHDISEPVTAHGRYSQAHRARMIAELDAVGERLKTSSKPDIEKAPPAPEDLIPRETMLASVDAMSQQVKASSPNPIPVFSAHIMYQARDLETQRRVMTTEIEKMRERIREQSHPL